MPHQGASPALAKPVLPREPPPADGGDEGTLLLSAVEAVPGTLRELFEHDALLDTEALAEVERTLAGVEERLARKELRVVVVGERRAGKTTLLDAIVGDRLLGGARTGLAVVTSLRRRDVPSYRARFASGKDDDFERRVPDLTSELDRAAEKLEAELADLQRHGQRVRLELGSARETRGRAQFEVERALDGVRQAREVAAGVSSSVALVEEDAARIERAIGAAELGIPASVRTAPPRWAFWLWIWAALFVLLHQARVLAYRALLRERETTRARLALELAAAAEASEAKALAEALLQPLDTGAEQARLHSSELEATLRHTDAERERLGGERDALRSEREHSVSDRWRRFFADLTALAKQPDLVELSIDYPAKLLPEDVTVIDMPGMLRDDSPEWELIREQADCCILVSELDRAVSQATKVFLRRLRDVVPHVILVLTKLDQAYARLTAGGETDPWAELAHACSIGTRRFARELGRAPDRVLSLSIAAEALVTNRGSDFAVRAERELDKLFLLLRRERALILGAHAARAIRRCIAGVADAEAGAERIYRERILELERSRTPEPAAFREQALRGAAPAVAEAARQATLAGLGALSDGFLELARACERTFDARAKRKHYMELASELTNELAGGAAAAFARARAAVDAGIESGVFSIEQELLEAVCARYRLSHEPERATIASPRLGALESEHPSFAAVLAEVQAAVDRFGRARFTLAASGLAAGAASGAMLHPWAGPFAGALLGGLLPLFRSQSALRGEALHCFSVALEARGRQYATELSALEPRATRAIQDAAERSLEREMLRLARWIDEPLEAERQVLETERAKLAALEGLRDRVGEHDRELERLLEAARRASVGLCRASVP